MTTNDSTRQTGQALRKARHAAGWTIEGLAAAIGRSKGQVSLMESGQRTISVECARAIEKALKIHDGRLVKAIEWHSTPPAIRESVARAEQERQALRLGLKRALEKRNPQQTLKDIRKLILDTTGLAAKSGRRSGRRSGGEPLPFRQFYSIPLINTVDVGYPREFTDMDYPRSVADEYVACPDVSDPDAFAARVVGDSMEPEYREGDIVVFAPMLDIPTGCDCFVRLERDNETTFKRVYFEDDKRTIRLQPLNNSYPPHLVGREGVAGMYAAVYVMRRVKSAIT